MDFESFRQLTDAEKRRVLSAMPRGATPAAAERTAHASQTPFALTDLQQAFFVGRRIGSQGERMGCQLYLEIALRDLDPARCERAWRRLAARHDMLRAVVRADGRQEVRPEPAAVTWKVTDLSAASARDLAAHLRRTREQLARAVYLPDQWPLYEIRLTIAPAGWTMIHVSLDEWIVDAASVNLLLEEWRQLYHDPATSLPALKGSFPEYVAALQRFESTPRFRTALDYWLKKLDPLPARPLLGARTSDAGGGERRRYTCAIGERAWARLQQRAAEAGASATALLLAAFGATLRAQANEARFAVILTWFNRPPLQPDIDRLVGPFTSTGLFVVDERAPATVDERIADCQRQLWADLDHNVVSGIRVLRELKTRGLAPAAYSVPVVFTSMLSTAGPEAHEGWLGQVTTLVSQTPQVELDCQVVQRDGRLYVHWDVAEDRFAPGAAARMLADYRRTLEAWAGIAEPAGIDLPPLLVLRPDAARRHDDFGLTDVQQAYLSARGGGAGDESCQVYQEFEAVELDVPRLQDAWRRLIDLHEMLRAVVLPSGRQRVLPQVPPYEIRVADLRESEGEPPAAGQTARQMAPPDQEAGLARVRTEMTRAMFALGEWPFFDLRVSRMDARRSRIHVAIDSLIADGPSLALLFAQWFALYEDPSRPLSAPGVNFRDYHVALQQFRTTPVAAECEAYWLEKLGAAPRGLPPALREGNGTRETGVGRERRVGILRAWPRLQETAARHGLDPEVVLLAAFTESLSRPPAGASEAAPFTTVVVDWRRLALHPDLPDVVGDFTGLCWIVHEPLPGATFIERLRRHDAALREDRRRAAVSGLAAMRKLPRTGAAARDGLPVVFSAPLPRRALRLPDSITAGFGLSRTPGVVLDGIHVEVGDELHFHWDTTVGCAPASVLDEAFARYQRLLEELASRDDWERVEALTEQPPPQIAGPPEGLSIIDGQAVDYPPDQCLHELIEAQAARTPDAEAACCLDSRLTYAELNAQANRCAHWLRRHGVGPDVLVAVMMERSTSLVVALLGILKAGAAYLPLDPESPEERLRGMLDDAKPAAIVTQRQFDDRLNGLGIARLRLGDGEGAGEIEGESAANPARVCEPRHLAYVIYTSGSTGRPKGCMIPHRAIVNRLCWMQQAYPIGAPDRVLQKTPATFDVSVWEFFWPLMTGACLVLARPGGHRNPRYLAELMQRERITTCHFVPPMLALFLAQPEVERCGSLRQIFASGEALAFETVTRCLERLPAAALHNLYGPTEAAVDVTYWPCERRADRKVPIGRPIANTRIALLDARGQPVARGAEGELHIGGVNLARGYLNREVLTRERFIADPTDQAGVARLYKTGDRARLLPDGNVEFLGRLDLQVKIRGHRVELGEIEETLRHLPEVAEAVVLLREAHTIDPLLVAYCSRHAGASRDEEAVRRALQRTLPAYMVPHRILFMEAIPMTRHGKIDREALPWPVSDIATATDAAVSASASASLVSRAFDTASTTVGTADTIASPESAAPLDAAALEAEIAAFVRESLQTASIDPDRDLFDQGATSFLVVQLAQRLEQAHGIKLSVDLFLEAPSIRGIARYVSEQRQVSAAPGEVNFFSPEERARFKEQRLHLRHDVDALPAVPLRSAAVDPVVYRRRTCARSFLAEPLAFDTFRAFLSLLRQGSVDGAPKYLYPSAGGLYGVQVYVAVKPGAVAGLDAGAYYYHPVADTLYRLSERQLDRSHHFYYNRPAFDEAGFALILAAPRDAVAPIYGDAPGIHFAAVEAGYMGQLLMSRAPDYGLGLLPIGAVDVKQLREPFRLSDGHILIHYMLGGPARIAQADASETARALPAAAAGAGAGAVTVPAAAAASAVAAAGGSARADQRQPIAVIGLSGRYAGAATPEALWTHLAAGERLLSNPPDERRALGLTLPGGYVDGIDRFDHRLFKISAVEARALDPAERLFLEVVWECLERAGYTAAALNRSATRVGVFVGTMWSDYLSAGMAGAEGGAPRSLGFHSSIANRVASYFDFKGPSLAIDTSCSSALTALHLACESLHRGECGAAIVGGVNLLAHPAHQQLLGALNLLARDGHSRAFSAEGSGWVAGEGIGAMLIRPADAAERGRDHVHGLFLGTAARHLGRTGEYGAPDAGEQARSIGDVLAAAGAAPDSIGYVEAAAAGASLADAAEVQALVHVFGQGDRVSTACRIGSVKPNVGHLEAASGMSQLTKVLMQLEQGQIAPSIDVEPVNPLLPLAGSPLTINQTLTPWPAASGAHDGAPVRPRRALINAFGATGTCAHVVVEERGFAHERSAETVRDASAAPVIVPLSAASPEQLETLARRLQSWAGERGRDARIADIAFSLQAGRLAMRHRLAMVVGDVEELLRAIATFLDDPATTTETTVRAAARLFTSAAREPRPAGSVRSAIETAASDWSAGAEVDWEPWRLGDERRIPLPTYPFSPDRHWVDRQPAVHAATAAETTFVATAAPATVSASTNSAAANGVANAAAVAAAAATVTVNAARASAIEERLRVIFSEEVEVPLSELRGSDSFESHGVNSFLITKLMARLAHEGLKLPTSALFHECRTLAELARAIEADDTPGLDHFIGAVPPESDRLASTPGPSSTSRRKTESETETVTVTALGPKSGTRETRDTRDEAIAILGMAGRYPRAANLEAFWQNLAAGRDCITEIPADRWDHAPLFDPRPGTPGRAYSRWGGFMEDVDTFDPLFFNISPREAAFMDPQERQFLEVAWSALEDAGYTRRAIAERIANEVGIFVGVMYGDHQLRSGLDGTLPLSVSFGSIAHRVSHFLDLGGPSLAVDTMCSSSLTALHLACESLRRDECRAALVGGVNLCLHPNRYLVQSQARMAASDGRCRAFGAGGDGFVPGEGVGALLLKPLRAAEADGDRILAVIRATTINHDGRTRAYAVPSPVGHGTLIRRALDRAAIPPESVSHIEVHGTGTALGDPIELSGLSKAFGTMPADWRCSIGSVKSNIGHLEPAAGVAAVTKLVLEITHRELVPSLHADTLNPNIDWDRLPFHVQRTREPWRGVDDEEGRPRLRAGVSSFGAGGANAHALLEDYPTPQALDRSETVGPRIVPLSARSASSLRAQAERLAAFLDTHAGIAFVDLVHTLATGREAMTERLAIVASSVQETVTELRAFLAGQVSSRVFRGLVQPASGVIGLLEQSEIDRLVERSIAGGKIERAAELWINGLDIDWRVLWSDRGGIVSLPTYAFDQERFALPRHAATDAAVEATTGEVVLCEWAWRTDATTATAHAASVSAGEEAGARTANTLVFDDDETVWRALQGSGARRAVLVTPGLRFGRVSADVFTIRPGSEDDLRQLADALRRDDAFPGRIVHLWCCERDEQDKRGDSGAHPPRTASDLLERGIYTLFGLVRCLPEQATANGATEPVRLIVAHGSRDAAGAAAGAALAGFCRTVSLEMPSVQSTLLELPAASRAAVASAIVSEALRVSPRAGAVSGVAVLRASDARLGTPEPSDIAALSAASRRREANRLVRGGLYLITGGLGALGLLLARRLLRGYGAHVILTGRSPVSRVAGPLAELAGLGGRAEYLPCDVADANAVQTLTETIRTRGALRGVVHAAGLLRDARLPRKTRGDLEAVLAPKLFGAINLDEAFGAERLDFFTAFSSLGAVTGNIGQCDYAFANAFLDRFAQERNARVRQGVRHGHTSSVAWPLWAEGGMRIDDDARARLARRTGLQPLPSVVGLEIFEELLGTDREHTIVLFGDAPRLRQLFLSDSAPISEDAPVADAEPNLEAEAPRERPKAAVAALASAGASTGTARGADVGAAASAEAASAPISSMVSPVPRQAARVVEPADVRAATESLVRSLLGEQLHLDPSRFATMEPLESYGIDSIAVAQFNEGLEAIVGAVSPGLLFEAPTVAAVVDALLRTHGPRLAAHFEAKRAREAQEAAPAATGMSAGPGTHPAANADAQPDAYTDTGTTGARSAGPSTDTSTSPGREPEVLAYAGERAAAQPRTNGSADGIAIIGLSGRYPQARNLDEFWSNLCAGRDAVSEIPLERWDYRPLYDPDPGRSKDGTLYGKWGAFLEEATAFDCRFFGISPREAEILDPQERLFLETAWATFEDAGYTRDSARRATGNGRAARVGVFVGVTTNSYLLWGPEQWAKGNRVLPATAFWSVANRVSYHMNFSGPSMPVDTACSSSLVAVHLACESIRRGECEMALTGGVNLYLHPSRYVQMSQIRMLSPTGRCRSFGAGADGMAPGEGVGAMLLKPVRQAIADGDHVYGVIRGTAINHDGRTNGFTVPNTAAQVDLVRQAMSAAGCDARSITCVEAHGSGTALGDPVEVDALSQAFRDHTGDRTFCSLGSVKSNIGHLESAAGIAGVTKVLLEMRHRTLVPSLHSGAANPTIDFETTPFRVQQRVEPWTVDRRADDGSVLPRRAGISSFGAGGANAHIIVDEPASAREIAYEPMADEMGPQIVVLSARDEARLREYATRLADALAERQVQAGESGGDGWSEREIRVLSDIAYTLQIGREAMTERLAFVASDTAAAASTLRAVARGESPAGLRRGRVKRVEPASAEETQAMARLLAERDLDGLAQAWTRGADLPWERLHTGRRRRVPLPTYPFERRLYWLPGTQPETTGSALGSPLGVGLAEIGGGVAVTSLAGATKSAEPGERHPWGPMASADAAGARFEALVSPTVFAVADHHIDGAGVFPAMAALELVFEAARLATSSTPDRLRHVSWLRPIVFGASPKRLAVRFVPVADAIRFEVITQEEASDTVHARGFLPGAEEEGEEEARRPAEPGGLQALLARLPLRSRDTAAIYDGFAQYGTDYGPAFRVIRELRGGVEEAVARLELAESLRGDAARFHLHPALVDGALHAIAGLEAASEARPEQGPCVPYSVGEVWRTGALPARCYTHVQQRRPGDPCYDVTIYDEQGIVQAGLREFRLRRLRVAENARPETDARGSAASTSTLYFTPVWRETDAPLVDTRTLASTTGDAATDDERLWVFVAPGASSFTATLKRAWIVTLEPGSRFEERGPSRFAVPVGSADAWRQLVTALVRTQGLPRRILYACALGARQSSTNERLDVGIRSLLPLSQALMELPGRDPMHLLVVHPEDEPRPEHSALGAFAGTLSLESTRLRCTVVGVDPAEQNLLATILSEFEAPERDVRRRGARRWVRALDEVEEVPAPSQAAVEVAGVWLVTGGAGSLGRLLASHLLTRGATSVALAGRSALIADASARVRALGPRAHYFQADVSNAASVRALVSSVRTGLGPIRGVIHAAGLTRDALIRTTTREQLEAVMAPKIFGTMHLDDALAQEPLDGFVLFASMAGLTGNQGQVAYAYANSVMDQFAYRREAARQRGERRGRTIVIDWPLWREGGMQSSAAVERWYRDTVGIVPMDSRAGLEAFGAALRGAHTQLAVLHGDAPRIREVFSSPHRTPSGAARHEVAAASASASAAAARTAGAGGGVRPETVASAPVASFGDAASTGMLTTRLSEAVVEMVARILKFDVDAIALDDDLGDYGFDSVSFTELAGQVNARFDLTETPALFYEHRTLASVVEWLIERHAAALSRSLTPPPAPAAAPAASAASSVSAAPAAPVASATPVEATPTIEADAPRSSAVHTPRRGGAIDTPIAIVGMSAQFPGAPDLDRFWRLLVEGRDAISEIPRDRWDWGAFYGDPHRDENKTDVRWGAFLDRVDRFDAEFFGISPHEARLMDPQQRLFLETVWKAIEDAGWRPSELAGSRTGVFAGVGTFEFVEVLRGCGVAIEPHSATGISHCILANRVSYLLDLRGPSEPIDTGCSASLVAVHRAIEAIRSGSCEAAIAGGVNLMLSPATFIAFSKAGMLSADGRCKTFDARADGYVRGEGVGVVLLEPLDRAERRGDIIHAVIRGSAVNHGGYVNTLTSPNPNAQADVIVRAVQQAGVPSSTIGLIEAHGSGTPLGDPVEINGLRMAFDQLAQLEGTPLAAGSCGVGSVKTNVGHLESAAGIAGLMKVLLALRHRTQPPSINFHELNPYIRLEDSPFFIVDTARPWPALRDEAGRETPRRAGVSSFGFGGANAHVVVEEYVDRRPTDRATVGEPELIVLSARTETRVREIARELRAWCDREEAAAPALSEIAYTLQVGRESMESRAAFVARTRDELRRGLGAIAEGAAGPPAVSRGQVRLRGRIAVGRAMDAATEMATGTDLDRLAAAWCRGATVDWTALSLRNARTAPRRLSLPTYPFEPTRHWPAQAAASQPAVSQAATSHAVASQAATPADEGAKSASFNVEAGAVGGAHETSSSSPSARWTVYRRGWTPLESSVDDASANASIDPRRPVLVIGDSTDLCASWRELMAHRWPGASILCADFDAGSAPAREGPRFRLRRDHPEDVRWLLDALSAGGEEPGAVFWLFPDAWRLNGLDLRFPAEPADVEQEMSRDLRGIFTLSKGLSEQPADERTNLFFVLNAPEMRAQPHLQALSALGRSLGQENPRQHYATVTLPFNELGTMRSVDILADLHESGRASASGELAYAHGRLVIPTLERVVTNGGEPGRDSGGGEGESRARVTLRRAGVYVITGGLGEIGRPLAAALARRLGAKVLLIGRRTPSEADEWEIARLGGGGGHVSYASADICDAAALGAALEDARRRLGPLNGIFHLARSVDDALFVSKDLAAFERVTRPKLAGTLQLDTLTREDPLDLFVMFASLAGVTGLRGGADYAYACDFQTRFAEERRRRVARAERRGTTLAICWPQWRHDRFLTDSKRLRASDNGMELVDVDHAIALIEMALAGDEAVVMPMLGDSARIQALVEVPAAAAATMPAADPAAGETKAPGRTSDAEALHDALSRLSDAEVEALRAALIPAAPGEPRPTTQTTQKPREQEAAWIRTQVRDTLGKVLGLSAPLEDDTRFERLGMDSILGAQVAMQLERRLNVPLPPRWLLEHDSVDALTRHLAAIPAGVAS